MSAMRVMLAFCVAATVFEPLSVVAADRPQVKSGRTQVVAKLNSREITIADLRSEMARLGMSPGDPAAEPAALQSIISRALLADAAREKNFHRQPEALRQMARAKEQALADMYLATASQPPEPTRIEIEDYIADNPEIFGKRRIYTFSVLTMPTAVFDEEDLTVHFDTTEDFAELERILDEQRVEYAVTPAVQPAEAFPKPIRKQLAEYSARDNIVIRGDNQAQIMKIMAIKEAPVGSDNAPAIARNVIMAEKAETRASRLLENLKKEASLAYYRETAAPPPVEGER